MNPEIHSTLTGFSGSFHLSLGVLLGLIGAAIAALLCGIVILSRRK